LSDVASERNISFQTFQSFSLSTQSSKKSAANCAIFSCPRHLSFVSNLMHSWENVSAPISLVKENSLTSLEIQRKKRLFRLMYFDCALSLLEAVAAFSAAL
jgi:hypothetical protein